MSNFTGFSLAKKRGKCYRRNVSSRATPSGMKGNALETSITIGFIRTMTIPSTQKCLPESMLSAISLYAKFPEVKRCTIYNWIRQWTDIKGKKQHPDRPEVHKFFLSLPSNMPLPKKRHLLQKEFLNVSRKLLNRWLNKWSGTQTLIRHPDKVPAREFFFSLSADMLLSEKRRLLYEKFPNVKRNTMNKWTLNWQSELTPKGDPK